MEIECHLQNDKVVYIQYVLEISNGTYKKVTVVYISVLIASTTCSLTMNDPSCLNIIQNEFELHS